MQPSKTLRQRLVTALKMLGRSHRLGSVIVLADDEGNCELGIQINPDSASTDADAMVETLIILNMAKSAIEDALATLPKIDVGLQLRGTHIDIE